MLNVLAVGYTYFFVYQYYEKYVPDRRSDEVILGLGLFFPITLYTNYVYGILIGLALGVCSILHQQIYLHNRNKKNLLFSVILIALAYGIKTNYLIFGIGILIIYCMDALFNKKAKSILGAIGIILGMILVSVIISKSMSIITEGASDNLQGIPNISYIVMGNMDTEAYGWFNSYNWQVYTDNDNDSEKAKVVSLEDLKREIQFKIDNPRRAIEFYHKKLTSIWCEASFGAFYNNRINYTTVLDGHSNLYNSLFAESGRGHRILSLYLEIYQSMIYLGAVLYLVYSYKEDLLLRLTGLIIFIGGFIFQIFWEAKSDYVLMYFALLIPYAVMGFEKCFDKLNNSTKKHKNIVCILMGITVLVLFSNILMIGEDTDKWDNYLREHRFINDGYYFLTLKDTEVYECENGNKIYLSIDMNAYYWEYEIQNVTRDSRLTVVGDKLEMISNDEVDFPSDAYWRWRIERESGGYCIRWWNDMNKVITYDEENASIYLDDYKEGNKKQIWTFERKGNWK
jgi:predicted nucleic acid-binding Zn ribbon protein